MILKPAPGPGQKPRKTLAAPRKSTPPVASPVTAPRVPKVVSATPNTLPAIQQDKLPATQNKAEIEAVLKNRFGEKSGVIIDMLEFGETDGAVSLLSRSLLQSLVEVLPLALHQVQASRGQKGIYQLNQLTSSVREMTIDLQALRDKGMLGQRIVERTVRPAFADIGVQIVLALSTLESVARSSMQTEDFNNFRAELNRLKAGLASFIQTQYAEVSTGVITALS